MNINDWRELIIKDKDCSFSKTIVINLILTFLFAIYCIVDWAFNIEKLTSEK